MKLREIYELAIKLGMDADPRGLSGAEKELAKAQKAYDKLDDDEKEFFDAERLHNPYADTRTLNGDDDAEINKLFCGVDIENGELAVIDLLNQRGQGIDLALAHHPEGGALAALGEVMNLQPGHLSKMGILPNIAEALLEGRINEVDRSINSTNHFRTVDSARLLDINMMCVHTPADNLVTKFMNELFAVEQPETVGDMIKLVKSIPEYHHSSCNNVSPIIVSGVASRSAGKIFVDFTGGTSGPKEIMKELSDAGISTVLCMHANEGMIKVAKEVHLNVVVAGHMASDSVGLNLFLDELEKRGVDVVAGSGLIRHKRF